MKTLFAISLALHALAAPLTLAGQLQPAMARHDVLAIVRETVKPGRSAEHDANEEAWVRAADAAKNTETMLAAGAMTGVPEIWYLSSYASWSDYEAALAANRGVDAIDQRFSAKEAELLSATRRMMFRSRRDLGYGPDPDLSRMRYLSITQVAVRPGRVAEFEESRRTIRAAHESAQAAGSVAVWEAMSGAPAGTFLIISAHRSLAEIDSGEAVEEAPPTKQGGAVDRSTTNVYRFLPQQSFAPDAWVKADPAFWGRKPLPRKP